MRLEFVLAASTSVVVSSLQVCAQEPFDRGMRASQLPAEALGRTTVLASADFDGDGDLDLLAASPDGPDRLWINVGYSRWRDETAARLPAGSAHTTAVAVGDVDGDLDLDLLLAAGNGQDRLYRNDGAGHFVDATTVALPARVLWTSAAAFLDADGDGDQDLLLGQFRPLAATPSVLLRNDGAGRFTDVSANALPPNAANTSGVLPGDFDRDGAIDVLLTGSPNLHLRNLGAGVFAVAPLPLPAQSYAARAAVTGDLDGDGDLDVVLGYVFQGPVLWRNDGAGTFTDATAGRIPSDPNSPAVLCLFDGDRDGDLDLAVGNSLAGQPDRLYRNGGTGVFTAWPSAWNAVPTETSRAFVAGDLDGDGTADLVVGTDLLERLYHNDGAGTFVDLQQPRLPALALGIDAAAIGDLDGDGAPDLVVAAADAPGVFVCRNDRSGGFSLATPNVPTVAARAVALGDLDGDGDLDVLLGGSGPERWLRNDGHSQLSVGTALPAATDTTSYVALGDVDGDGDLDALIGNYGQQVRFLANGGVGDFTDATATHLPPLATYCYGLSLGDADGDQDLDLFLASTDVPFGQPIRPRLFQNDGAGHFTEVTATHLPPAIDNTNELLLADLDRDGDLDLFLANAGIDQILRNDGTGHFAEPTTPVLPQHVEFTAAVAAGDVDRDGDLDLVVSHAAGSRLYHNDGFGTFTEAAAVLPARLTNVRFLGLADLDADEDPDLVNIDASGAPFLHANRLTQAGAPWAALAGTPYELEFACRPGATAAGRFAIPAMGWTLAPTPMPVVPFGWFLLAPAGLLNLQPWVAIDPATGVGSYGFAVPTAPELQGQRFAVQALIVDPVGIATHLTNVVGDVVRR